MADNNDYCGSCRDASFNGISFRVVADADVTIQNIAKKRERMRAYGNSWEKVTEEQCYIAGLKLAVTEAEYDTLKTIHEEIGKIVKGSVTTANGSMYKGRGSFSEISERSAMDGTVTVRFDAETDFNVLTV